MVDVELSTTTGLELHELLVLGFGLEVFGFRILERGLGAQVWLWASRFQNTFMDLARQSCQDRLYFLPRSIGFIGM